MRLRACAMAAAVLALSASACPLLAQTAVVKVEFSQPAMDPPHWTMLIYPDGSGHFESDAHKVPSGRLHEIDAPSVNRDIRLSPRFANYVFETARRHNWFNESCDSHLKVALQGWKTLSYMGPAGTGSCTFNYSTNKEMQTLGDSLVAVAQTLFEGARIEMLLQHDPLGLDKEMDFLARAAQDGRARQLGAIREILERLAQDDAVLDRVRKRARMLLAKADT